MDPAAALGVVRATLQGSTDANTVTDVRPALARLEATCAANERVRELCEDVDNDPGDGKVWAAAVLEVLDGETEA